MIHMNMQVMASVRLVHSSNTFQVMRPFTTEAAKAAKRADHRAFDQPRVAHDERQPSSTMKMPSGISPAPSSFSFSVRLTLESSSCESTGPSAGLMRQRIQM